jgi:hypothetical protein
LLYLLLSSVLIGCQQQAEDGKIEEKQHIQNSRAVQSTETKSFDVREAVWNQLSDEHKKQIQGTWKDASVYQRVLRQEMGFNIDKTYIGKEVFIVGYPSNDNPTLGGIIVYADIKSHKLIGYGYRD